jgi:hypothetical protein
MDVPTECLCVVPSRVTVGEPFRLKIKALGVIRPIPSTGHFNTLKPRLRSPYNLNPSRGIQFMDNALPEWSGKLRVLAEPGIRGPTELVFDGINQGVFPGDTRPIRAFDGFVAERPGFHFIRVEDPVSGATGCTNPVLAVAGPLTKRLVWGDPHWQTFFSDGIRCPEELYAFARDEAFLDFGAVSDHMEAITPRQWDYFQAVTNDCNQPGRFATLIGQEWTHHHPATGAPGHRNIYVRGAAAPLLSSLNPESDRLDKLWARLRGLDALAIPHHSANKVMGTKWELGWNPEFEKAVEIYSVWGSSECHAADGNTRPIRTLQGEQRGRHIRDALRLGYRFGFVGGGDIHDGRPGDDLHTSSYPGPDAHWHQGFTAAWVPELTREAVFDAIHGRRTYAATKRRIYLESSVRRQAGKLTVSLRAASEDGLAEIALCQNAGVSRTLPPGPDPRVLEASVPFEPGDARDYLYVRVRTRTGDLAWASPIWADEIA